MYISLSHARSLSLLLLLLVPRMGGNYMVTSHRFKRVARGDRRRGSGRPSGTGIYPAIEGITRVYMDARYMYIYICSMSMYSAYIIYILYA